jgi:hypothetical protein
MTWGKQLSVPLTAKIFWDKYDNNVVLHSLSVNITYFFYPTVDIKKNSKNIWPIAPKFTSGINNDQNSLWSANIFK